MKKSIYRRKEITKDLSIYTLIQLSMSDICALTEDEFLREYDKCVVEVFKEKPKELDAKLNDWLGVENWRKHFDGPFPSEPTDLVINGYSNYKELMDEAKLFADHLAKRAFKMEKGRVHRSTSRISILLSITASEDFANLQCFKNLKLSKRKIGSISLLEKWRLLIPDFDNKFSEFSKFLKIRNTSIIHFKDSDKLDFKNIIDLNYKNASSLVELVLKMMLEYKLLMRDAWDVVDPNSFLNILVQYLEISQDLMAEIINSKANSTTGNNV